MNSVEYISTSEPMSNRVSGFAPKGIKYFTATLIAAIALTGCSSLVGQPRSDSVVTGSVAGANTGNLSQAMPSRLTTNVASSSSRFTPPADIGRAQNVAPITTGSIQTSQFSGGGQGNLSSVRSQALPAPISGSNKIMSAQPAVQPFKVASNEVTNAPVVAAQPKLSVVKGDPYLHEIQAGESLYTIARQYGVTTGAIVHGNGMSSPDKIFVGQKVIIPGKFTESVAQTAPVQVAQAIPAKIEQQMPAKLETQPIKTVAAVPASARPKTVQPGIDKTTTSSIPELPQFTPPVPAHSRPASLRAPTKVVAAKPAQVTAPVITAPKVKAPAQVAAAPETGKFRWPVSGSVLSDFASSKSGINISAQEGAAVRAAENGTVIYVGSAVEGYGNLILVKHDDGFVSAYAHLKDITVAKGDRVGRGNAIGSVGMSGAVSRPQLHFELRKGATPVDPVPLLAS